MYGRGSRGPTRHVCSICSVVRTRDRVAGAGYACNARPDLHTVCRSFPKISSALSAKVCGGSRSAKILISMARGTLCKRDSEQTCREVGLVHAISGHLCEVQIAYLVLANSCSAITEAENHRCHAESWPSAPLLDHSPGSLPSRIQDFPGNLRVTRSTGHDHGSCYERVKFGRARPPSLFCTR
jgi:hypothetical protein